MARIRMERDISWVDRALRWDILGHQLDLTWPPATLPDWLSLISNWTQVWTRVVKADFLKAVREAVAQRLIKAVKRLLYVVNKTNDCFKMHLTSVRLWASTFHY